MNKTNMLLITGLTSLLAYSPAYAGRITPNQCKKYLPEIRFAVGDFCRALKQENIGCRRNYLAKSSSDSDCDILNLPHIITYNRLVKINNELYKNSGVIFETQSFKRQKDNSFCPMGKETCTNKSAIDHIKDVIANKIDKEK